MRAKLRVRWSLAVAHRARELAIAERDIALRARVTGHSTRPIREVGGACVRLQLLDAPLCPGGWAFGVRAPDAAESGFAPAIGGAPGDHRHGILDAMVMARRCDDEGAEVGFVQDDELARWLPIGAEVHVAPIWQCTDFFDLRRQFEAVDSDGSGAIDRAELRELLRRCHGAPPSEADVDRLLEAADSDGDALISWDEFCGTGFAATRLRARLLELADRATARVEEMHARPPWRGVLAAGETASFDALLSGTGLEHRV